MTQGGREAWIGPLELGKVVGDPLPYGIAANRPAIEALIRYCHQQGLLPRRYSAAEMFIDA